LALIAEDLGWITDDVRRLMQRHGLTGMRVLQFGFSGDPASNANAPMHVPENCVVYSGTHDNNTPGRMRGNWRWRMTPAQFASLPRRRLRAMTETFGRSHHPHR
jgi:4-alpha-glucanotransferase